MINKEYGKFTAVCDICLKSMDEEFDNYQDAVDAKKKQGWTSKKVSGEWWDACPECQKL